MRQALLIGAKGQDGRLLHARLLGEEASITALGRGDIALDDPAAARTLVGSHPEEVYYLAAHHHSSQDTLNSGELDLFRTSVEVHVSGLVNFLEAIRACSPATRLFYAASSLIFGDPPAAVQDEKTPFNPSCVYGITKAAGLRFCRYYRERHGVFASGGILFNHESPFRQPKFVIPKIIDAALAIARGEKGNVCLGDLSARVDWGYAPDFVDAMTRILRLPEPGDYIIATGETHSVQDAVENIFGILGMDWRSHVEESVGILTRRRSVLCGDARKLREATGWQPSVAFDEMLRILVQARQDAIGVAGTQAAML